MPARTSPRTSRPTGEFRFHCVWGGYGPDEGCRALAEMSWHRNKWQQRLYCREHREKVGKMRLPGRVQGYRNGYWLVRTGLKRPYWRPQHLVIVEQELGRPLTNQEALRFRDRDHRNLSRRNLYLMSGRLQGLRLYYWRLNGGRPGEPETSPG